jgi:isoleucyl-tRNA synthetase
MDPAQIASAISAGENLKFELNGDSVELSSEEVLVSTESAEGLAVAADKVVTVAIDTHVTPELRAEGWAREIVRRIQTQRKNADFNIEDHIKAWYTASGELNNIFVEWSEYIKAETLTTELIDGDPPAEAFVEKHTVEGKEFTIGLKKN